MLHGRFDSSFRGDEFAAWHGRPMRLWSRSEQMIPMRTIVIRDLARDWQVYENTMVSSHQLVTLEDPDAGT